MKREVKFRGQSTINGEWKYGYYVVVDGYNKIISAKGETTFVHPPSVGLYTGLKDKNGKEIYEGDLLRWPSGNVNVIEWINDRACFSAINIKTMKGGRVGIVGNYVEVIGNIYEHPNLLQ